MEEEDKEEEEEGAEEDDEGGNSDLLEALREAHGDDSEDGENSEEELLHLQDENFNKKSNLCAGFINQMGITVVNYTSSGDR